MIHPDDSAFQRLNELPWHCCEFALECACDSCHDWRSARIRAIAAQILAGRTLPAQYDSTRPPANDNACSKTSRPPSMPAVRTSVRRAMDDSVRRCSHCSTLQLAVTFDRVVGWWPDDEVCGDCAEAWADEHEADREYDLIHGGACGCHACT